MQVQCPAGVTCLDAAGCPVPNLCRCPRFPAAVPGASVNSIKGKQVNKSELIDVIAEAADVSKATAGRVLDAAVDAVSAAMKKGDTVTLVGFGSFYVGERAEREGRNPQTGKSIKIKAAKVPKFRAGKSLKDAVN